MRIATRLLLLLLLFALTPTAHGGLPRGSGETPPEGFTTIRVFSDGTVFPPFPNRAFSRRRVVLHADADAPASSVVAVLGLSCPTGAERLLNQICRVQIATRDAKGIVRSFPIELPDEQLPIAAPPFPLRHGILVSRGERPYHHQALRSALPVLGHRLDLPRVKKLASAMVRPGGRALDLGSLRKAVGDARNESVVLFVGKGCLWGDLLAAWLAFTNDDVMRIAACPRPHSLDNRGAWEMHNLNALVPAGSDDLPEFAHPLGEVTVGLLEDGTAVLQPPGTSPIEEYEEDEEEKLLARVGRSVTWRETSSWSSFLPPRLVIVARPGVAWRRIAALARLGPTTLVVRGEKAPRSIFVVKEDGRKPPPPAKKGATWEEVAPALPSKIVLTD